MIRGDEGLAELLIFSLVPFYRDGIHNTAYSSNNNNNIYNWLLLLLLKTKNSELTTKQLI